MIQIPNVFSKTQLLKSIITDLGFGTLICSFDELRLWINERERYGIGNSKDLLSRSVCFKIPS